MRVVLRVAALTALVACSATVTSSERMDNVRFTSEGQLTLTVSDAPAQPGLLFITGTVEGGQGKVTVRSTRYGSVCATDITAHADVASGKITLRVTYSERLALCTADIRAITYRAEVSALAPGAYDVEVIHVNADGTGGTVLNERVKVT